MDHVESVDSVGEWGPRMLEIPACSYKYLKRNTFKDKSPLQTSTAGGDAQGNATVPMTGRSLPADEQTILPLKSMILLKGSSLPLPCRALCPFLFAYLQMASA